MAETNTAPTELRLTVSGTEALEHLRALREWLTLEEALRGRLTLHGEAPEPGHMGTSMDVLMVALGSGGAGAVLARSLTTWLVQRRSDVKVTVQAPNGGHVEVDVKRAADPARVIAEVHTLLGQLES
ncbi:hypothetical protein AB0I52_21315 [Streptomyces sp. NPDC050423]|uniref:effector-associated constant component EACC1 n=1 Tax=Streptomyces sp. NPDC050423 TaxID=3155402 RepID=UPI00342E4DC1